MVTSIDDIHAMDAEIKRLSSLLSAATERKKTADIEFFTSQEGKRYAFRQNVEFKYGFSAPSSYESILAQNMLDRIFGENTDMSAGYVMMEEVIRAFDEHFESGRCIPMYGITLKVDGDQLKELTVDDRKKAEENAFKIFDHKEPEYKEIMSRCYGQSIDTPTQASISEALAMLLKQQKENGTRMTYVHHAYIEATVSTHNENFFKKHYKLVVRAIFINK